MAYNCSSTQAWRRVASLVHGAWVHSSSHRPFQRSSRAIRRGTWWWQSRPFAARPSAGLCRPGAVGERTYHVSSALLASGSEGGHAGDSWPGTSHRRALAAPVFPPAAPAVQPEAGRWDEEDDEAELVRHPPVTLSVRSFFVAEAGINVDGLLASLPKHWDPLPGKHAALLQLPAAHRKVPEDDTHTAREFDSYVSVFKRGAMVFVNCDFASYLEAFNLVKKNNASTARPEYGEACLVEVDPSATSWSQLRGETLVVQQLDFDNLRILDSVMAQTVILDYYERQVDSMLETVQDLNRAIEHRDSSKLKSSRLFSALTRVNDISIQVIMSGLRNKFRPGTSAWKEEKYFAMQQTLWEQYELEERYEQLESKVTYINDVIKYCLDVQKEGKFMRLERAIVYLITAELAISLVHSPFSEWLSELASTIAEFSRTFV